MGLYKEKLQFIPHCIYQNKSSRSNMYMQGFFSAETWQNTVPSLPVPALCLLLTAVTCKHWSLVPVSPCQVTALLSQQHTQKPPCPAYSYPITIEEGVGSGAGGESEGVVPQSSRCGNGQRFFRLPRFAKCSLHMIDFSRQEQERWSDLTSPSSCSSFAHQQAAGINRLSILQARCSLFPSSLYCCILLWHQKEKAFHTAEQRGSEIKL